ncbi:MAG: 1-acyl-sn-glycerol-3-phosphate acyltransferase [Candidatus Amulumruptor caecigallinarius]|nr:1-acyl-sn-glycerol-3-phosphate acyltransferase [Candidatus Amulumruptor caecigallinarius]
MKNLARALYLFYQYLIAGPIFLVLTLLTALVTALGCTVGNSDFWGYWPAHIWSRITCRLFLMRVTVEGRENIRKGESYVFVSNHQGAYDIWAIYGYLNHNFKWLMKKELEKIFAVGRACKKAGQVFVDDSSINGIKDTIAQAEERLKHGMSVVVFPEGSRSFDGHLIPFKRGAFMLAAEFRLPVVPITVDGSFKAMPRTTYNMTPTRIKLTIHRPIYPPQNGFNTKKLMLECRDVIASSLPGEAERLNP